MGRECVSIMSILTQHFRTNPNTKNNSPSEEIYHPPGPWWWWAKTNLCSNSICLAANALNLPVELKSLKRDGLVSQRVFSKSCEREDGLMNQDLGNILLKGQETKKTKKERFFRNTSASSSVPSWWNVPTSRKRCRPWRYCLMDRVLNQATISPSSSWCPPSTTASLQERASNTSGAWPNFFTQAVPWIKKIRNKSSTKWRDAVEYVKKDNMIKFAARCRRYMMAYMHLANGDNRLTYAMIERFVKVSKTHRNIGDQEKGFIQKVILESISL